MALPDAPTASQRWPARAGGIAALIGAAGVLVGCALPYATITYGTDDPTHPSVFNSGFGGNTLFAAEPLAVVMFTFVAAIILLTPTRPILHSVAAGMLIAFGIQTFAFFFGYIGLGTYSDSSNKGSIGIGSVIGMVAGLCVLAGGLIALLIRRGSPRKNGA
ncbi:MAG: hypothetical protein E6H90_07280 [Chloroflexi bacterium]|nr:MAG: hypothetical protein E6H90_07280 [Chloroflexota bacterium]